MACARIVAPECNDVAGSGTIGGYVVITGGGILAPGNSPGTLTIAGDLTLNPASVLNYKFSQSNVVGGPT